MIRISVISYSNSLPFRIALENSDYINSLATINTANPKICAESIINKKSDIALVSIAALAKIKDYNIISDYCLAAYDRVDSVLLLSNTKKENIKNIYLDFESMTSVKIIKIISKFSWNKNYNFIDLDASNNLTELDSSDAVLVIGDKAFKESTEYIYSYDMATEWYEYTQLPAIFAVWISCRNDIPKEFIDNFNDTLKLGVEKRAEYGKLHQSDYKYLDLENYLTKRMDYLFDNKKRKSLELFLEQSRQV